MKLRSTQAMSIFFPPQPKSTSVAIISFLIKYATPPPLDATRSLRIINVQTAVHTLVNGVITHQKQQIPKKVILLSSTLTLRQCHAA